MAFRQTGKSRGNSPGSFQDRKGSLVLLDNIGLVQKAQPRMHPSGHDTTGSAPYTCKGRSKSQALLLQERLAILFRVEKGRTASPFSRWETCSVEQKPHQRIVGALPKNTNTDLLYLTWCTLFANERHCDVNMV